jgi:hypothetical protein
VRYVWKISQIMIFFKAVSSSTRNPGSTEAN